MKNRRWSEDPFDKALQAERVVDPAAHKRVRVLPHYWEKQLYARIVIPSPYVSVRHAAMHAEMAALVRELRKR